MISILTLVLNAGAAIMHWHFRKAKFNVKGRKGLAFDIGWTLLPAAALLWLNGYYTGFAAFAFWVMITALNTEANNILGNDIYNKQWHRWQWLQWATFHILLVIESNWQYSLALFGIAVFIFDGCQNIFWKPGGKRPWFYVGLHSGGIDTWLSKKKDPQAFKKWLYIGGLIATSIPLIIKFVIICANP